MKQLLLIALLAACGGKSQPAPVPDPPAACEDPPTTAEQCECHGWQVVGDIGDGQVQCPEGTTEMSRLQYGIEGGVCCAPAAAP